MDFVVSQLKVRFWMRIPTQPRKSPVKWGLICSIPHFSSNLGWWIIIDFIPYPGDWRLVMTQLIHHCTRLERFCGAVCHADPQTALWGSRVLKKQGVGTCILEEERGAVTLNNIDQVWMGPWCGYLWALSPSKNPYLMPADFDPCVANVINRLHVFVSLINHLGCIDPPW